MEVEQVNSFGFLGQEHHREPKILYDPFIPIHSLFAMLPSSKR